MALNDIKFLDIPGGLNRLPAGEDHVSGLFIGLADTPAGWTDALGKKYQSLEEAEADGIVETDADFILAWYFLREFFQIAGTSEVYVIDSSDAAFTAQNVFALTDGRMRQVYWYDTTAYAGLATKVGAVQTFADALAALHAHCFFLISVKDEATAVNGTAQADMRALESENVSILNAGDGSGKGFEIADALGVNYIPAGGAFLGAWSRAGVHENIGWVAKFNLAHGAEFQKIIFSDGQDYNALSSTVLDALNTKGYLFLRKHIGIAGSYANDTHTATAATEDLAYAENVRTMQKAKREVRAALLPDLNSPLTVDEDGKLSPDTIEYFKNKTSRPLERMQAAGELSGFSVTIDPNQNVLSTSILKIVIRLQPRGVARTIQVSVGYAVNIAA